MKLSWIVLLATFMALAPGVACAQVAAAPPAKPAQEKDEPETVKLVLHPAPEPRPAMKYFLYPPLLDRRPGNAAVIYGKVSAARTELDTNGELREKIANWVEMPLEKLPKDEMHKRFDGHSRFRFLDSAARRESVDWELPVREEEFFTILLPELQQLRDFGRSLSAKARLEIADGKYDDALHTLQTGYALARHASEGPTLIHALVGIAISNTMCKQVETLAQQPGAPNLYWALTHLPQPLADMRRGFEAEWSMIYLSYPELRDLDKKDLSPEEWRRMLEKLFNRFQAWSDGGLRAAPPLQPLVATGVALWAYPQAKQGMIARGYTAAQVEAMPAAKVVLLDTMLTYNEFRDEMFKWFAVPWPQAQKGLADAERRLHNAEHQGAIPVARALLPAIGNAYRAEARHERSIAALRVVEAIRLYGASHAAHLPDKLDDVTEVPIPQDPMTGKPFVYQRTGDRAVLESPGGKAHGMRYEITFAAKGK
jgi:hypothetical protein